MRDLAEPRELGKVHFLWGRRSPDGQRWGKISGRGIRNEKICRRSSDYIIQASVPRPSQIGPTGSTGTHPAGQHVKVAKTVLEIDSSRPLLTISCPRSGQVNLGRTLF